MNSIFKNAHNGVVEIIEIGKGKDKLAGLSTFKSGDIANPLIGKANQPLSTKNIKKKVNIVNLSSNTNKKFDWESKTYK